MNEIDLLINEAEQYRHQLFGCYKAIGVSVGTAIGIGLAAAYLSGNPKVQEFILGTSLFLGAGATAYVMNEDKEHTGRLWLPMSRYENGQWMHDYAEQNNVFGVGHPLRPGVSTRGYPEWIDYLPQRKQEQAIRLWSSSPQLMANPQPTPSAIPAQPTTQAIPLPTLSIPAPIPLPPLAVPQREPVSVASQSSPVVPQEFHGTLRAQSENFAAPAVAVLERPVEIAPVVTEVPEQFRQPLSPPPPEPKPTGFPVQKLIEVSEEINGFVPPESSRSWTDVQWQLWRAVASDCPNLMFAVMAKMVVITGPQQSGKTTLGIIIARLREILLGHEWVGLSPHEEAPRIFSNRAVGTNNNFPEMVQWMNRWQFSKKERADGSRRSILFDEIGKWRLNSALKKTASNFFYCLLTESDKHGDGPIAISHAETLSAGFAGIEGVYELLGQGALKLRKVYEIGPTGEQRVSQIVSGNLVDGSAFSFVLPEWLTPPYLHRLADVLGLEQAAIARSRPTYTPPCPDSLLNSFANESAEDPWDEDLDDESTESVPNQPNEPELTANSPNESSERTNEKLYIGGKLPYDKAREAVYALSKATGICTQNELIELIWPGAKPLQGAKAGQNEPYRIASAEFKELGIDTAELKALLPPQANG